MKRCSHPEHPHCTVWVMPGESACAHGHAQPVVQEQGPDVNLLIPAAGPIVAGATPLQRPHLHVSGFDPRAAGGRQVLKLELRGMPAGCAPQVSMLASSRLRLDSGERHGFARTGRGEWLPVFLEFSSRGLEHGQYRIELELHSRPEDALAPARVWIATLLILAPRLDASLHDIHQTFLATHKNVRVSADDASIARVKAGFCGGSVDIDVSARNAGIAHLDLDAAGGKIDLGFSSIAWDEDLIEIDQPLRQPQIHPAPARHPCPASTACLVFEAPERVRHLRLFALDECVLGRFEHGAPEADLLLAHHGQAEPAGPCVEGLTRRISARHALIRRGRDGYEIEDVSRYGLLLDGAWPGKHLPVPLRPGMRIELTASIPGVAVLEVAAVLPNGVILRRLDAGMAHEAFYLLDPERDPETLRGTARGAHASGMPLLFHRDGGFWQRDPAGGEATPLAPASAAERLAGWQRGPQFALRAYPELQGGTAAPSFAPARRALAQPA
ncbi:FHA domain-containing protein [Massilia niabensis]|uniref:FHA domain-containing protein n=1 Tax=Massilia niabensis TaxID=544910 RepID=A0ABW0L202_9BURK